MVGWTRAGRRESFLTTEMCARRKAPAADGLSQGVCALRIAVDRDLKEPLYQQVMAAIRDAIAGGDLTPGQRLPTTRDLADQIGVTRLTIVRAYGDLAAEGLLEGHVGRGTFVAAGAVARAGGGEPPAGARPSVVASAGSPSPAPAPAGPAPQNAGAWWQQLIRLAERPGLISFASGMPAPDLFPVEALKAAMTEVLDRDGAAALQYDAPEGYGPLRESIARHLSEAGATTTAGQVLITSGTQQAVDLIARLHLRPGDAVLTEVPTYAGALEVFEAAGARVVGVEPETARFGDAGGSQSDATPGALVEAWLRAARRHRPRLIYTIPACQGFAGRPMPPEVRAAILRAASELDAIVVEDDAYRALSYEQPPPPLLRADDPDGRVLHVGSFSKLLAPGLRVGYLCAPPRRFEALAAAKQAADLHTSTLLQRAVERFLDSGQLRGHLARARHACRARRDAMAAALAAGAAEGLDWAAPAGGPFVWARLPAGRGAVDAYLAAIDEGVAFAVGAAFMPDRADRGHVRLNFTIHPEPQIRAGVERLCRSLHGRPAARAAPI